MKHLYLLVPFIAIGTIKCGKDSKKDASEGAGASMVSDPPQADDSTVSVPDRLDSAADHQKSKIQLSEEAVGVKTGAQIIAHFSLVTGVNISDFDENQKRDLATLKKSLPEKNTLETFSSAHPPAALKVATYFCIKLVDQEALIIEGKLAGKKARLPDIDYSSPKPLSKEVARVLYDPLIQMFAGLDSATLPEKSRLQPTLDELVDRLRQLPPASNGRTIGTRAMVIGMCTAVASSMVSLWI